MADPNGLASSDDELFVDGAFADPEPFTFQSDLSDDDDVPDPLPLDEIATATLAALNGTLAGLVSPPEDEPMREPEDEPEDEPENEPMCEPTHEDEPRPATKDKHTSHVRTNGGFTPIKIEVRLPWLSPAQRAEHRRVEVQDYRPGDDGHPRTRRRRHAVSRFPSVASSLVSRICLGHGAYEVGLDVGDWEFSMAWRREAFACFQTIRRPKKSMESHVSRNGRTSPSCACPSPNPKSHFITSSSIFSASRPLTIPPASFPSPDTIFRSSTASHISQSEQQG